jgi:hypothetical protein
MQTGTSSTVTDSTDSTKGSSTDVNAQLNWNSETSNSETKETNESSNVEAKPWGVGGGKTWGSSNSNTSGSSKSLGGSIGGSVGTTASHTTGHSSSDTTDTRTSDSLAQTMSNTKTNEKNWSKTNTLTNGNSKSNTVGETNTYSSSNTRSQELSNTETIARSIDKTNSQSTEKSVTMSVTYGSNYEFGTSVVGVLLPRIQSKQIQWACVGEGETKIVNSEFAIMKNKVSEINKDILVPSLLRLGSEKDYFEIVNDKLRNKIDIGSDPTGNSLTSETVVVMGGRPSNIVSKDVLFSANYKLVISAFGNMYITRKGSGNTRPVWSTGTTIKRTTDRLTDNALVNKVSDSRIRLMINNYGHILLQADDMFKNQP